MSAQSGRLQHAVKNLRDQWEIARVSWDDQVARDFEKNHIAPVEQIGKSTIIGMDKLSEVLTRLRRACEE
jgi:hypothetical protein